VLGSLATLDNEGYQAVAKTCCQLEMEMFVRRVIESLSLDLCDEGGLLSLLPLYATCGSGANDFAALRDHISSAAQPGACSFVAGSGSCPASKRSPVCMGGVPEASHRRRHCNAAAREGQASLVQEPKAADTPFSPQDATKAGHTVTQCELPEGALWCEVRLANLPPFHMATYDWNKTGDMVSKWVCLMGHWEEHDIAAFGPPGHMLDIGGNIGYHSFAFAQAGWTVDTFEPMLPNLALIGSTLCRNPDLASRIKVNWFGLGAKAEQCKMVAPIDNVGDGITRCADGAASTQTDESTFVEIGHFDMRRLDEVLLHQRITQVDLVKIDTEGYEFQVFAGAPNFLTQYHPRLIKSEVWYDMVGNPKVSGTDYLELFEKAGYKMFKDSKCQMPLDVRAALLKASVDVIMCK